MKTRLHPSHPAVANLSPTDLLAYPERVIQFGTGVLLRGLPDFIFNQANKTGHFKGRVVMVKSTQQGSTQDLVDQGGLYTVCLRGWDKGETVEENHVVSCLSRVLSVEEDWETILSLATQPALDILISNTTEVGIQKVTESIREGTPHSFPGRVLAYLYARYQAFAGDPTKGMVIIPTELISNNADVLRQILLDVAQENELEPAFITWVKTANTFCNSLVDRIVPGKPQGDLAKQIADELPYVDAMTLVAEPYALWAIEGDDSLLNRLSFCQAGAGASLHPSIEKFKELKLRLLNGTHSISCGLAFLSGFQTVREAMANPDFAQFVEQVATEEIAPAIPSDQVNLSEAHVFAGQVLNRFRNPYLDHFWLSISLQYTQKMRARMVPLIENYVATQQSIPVLMSLGFAAYLHLLRVDEQATGTFQGQRYVIQDPLSRHFTDWYHESVDIVSVALSANFLWGTDLTQLDGWESAVRKAYDWIQGQLDTHGRILPSALTSFLS